MHKIYRISSIPGEKKISLYLLIEGHHYNKSPSVIPRHFYFGTVRYPQNLLESRSKRENKVWTTSAYKTYRDVSINRKKTLQQLSLREYYDYTNNASLCYYNLGILHDIIRVFYYVLIFSIILLIKTGSNRWCIQLNLVPP